MKVERAGVKRASGMERKKRERECVSKKKEKRRQE